MNLRQFRLVMGQVFLVPLLALAALALALAVQIRSAADTVGQIQNSDRRIARIATINQLLIDQETGLRGFQIAGDRRFLEPYNRGERELDPMLDRFKDRLVHGPNPDRQQAAQVDELHARYRAWRSGFAANVLRAASAGTELRDPEINLVGKAGMDGMRSMLSTLSETVTAQRTARIDRWQRQVKTTLWFLFVLALAMGLLIGLFTRSRLHLVSTAFRGSIEQARRRAEDSFRAEEELRTTLRSIGDGVIQTDADGFIKMMNPIAEEMTGWSLDEALGAPIADVFPVISEGSRDVLETPVAKVLRHGEIVKLANHALLIRRDKTELDIADSGAPIRDNTGKIVGVIMVCRDVSLERRSQEALIANEKLAVSGRVAATIAHEIHNPLDAVQNLLFLIRDGSSPAETQEYLQLAQAELTRVTEISRAMLGMHRQSSSPVALDLCTTLSDVLLLMDRRLKDLGVHAVSNLTHRVEICGYPGELKQVFSNLIANAAEAAGEGGLVEIHLREGAPEPSDTGEPIPDGVVVTVRDNGPGIADDTLRKIFEPFFTTKGEGGTGLGLWVSRGIIAKHGGTLTLHSNTTTSDHGTTAEVYLPLHSPASLPDPSSESGNQASPIN